MGLSVCWPGCYFAGDGARRDEDGCFWVMGRVDDVLNVAGHRIGTMEVESALVDHPSVAEAAVVGRPHEIKGQALAAFVTLKEGTPHSDLLLAELKEHVVRKIGAIARPDDIIFSADLPKTRSGKIMRRLLRNVAEDQTLGDTTTLADPSVVEGIKAQQDALKMAIKDQMLALGMKSVNTDAGTIVLSTSTRYSTTDWDSFKKFIIEHDAVDLLEKRIAQKNMATFLEENPGVMPEGLNSYTEYGVSVRKPK